MRAVITAGGLVDGPFAAAIGTAVKALARCGERTLLDVALDACEAAGIDGVALIGGSEIRAHAGARERMRVLDAAADGRDERLARPRRLARRTVRLPHLGPAVRERGGLARFDRAQRGLLADDGAGRRRRLRDPVSRRARAQRRVARRTRRERQRVRHRTRRRRAGARVGHALLRRAQEPAPDRALAWARDLFAFRDQATRHRRPRSVWPAALGRPGRRGARLRPRAVLRRRFARGIRVRARPRSRPRADRRGARRRTAAGRVLVRDPSRMDGRARRRAPGSRCGARPARRALVCRAGGGRCSRRCSRAGRRRRVLRSRARPRRRPAGVLSRRRPARHPGDRRVARGHVARRRCGRRCCCCRSE